MRRVGHMLLVVTALVGVGCGDDSSSATSPTETTVSPLSALLGYQNETPEESRRKQLEVENLTAECMREEGWEYQPVDWAAQGLQQDQPTEEWGSDAFGEKYGYGVVYNYETYEEQNILNDGEVPEGQEFVDPNQDYVTSLSEDEQQQYYESLYGDQSSTEATYVSNADGEDATADTEAAIVPFGAQGCQGIADEEVYATADPTRDNPDLQDRLSEYYENQQDDPKIEAATQEWLACVEDKIGDIEVNGGPPKQIWDMYQYIDNLRFAAMGLELVPWDGEEQLDDMYSGMTNEDGTGTAYVGKPQVIPEAELETLRQTELDTWRDDRACQDKARIKEIQLQAEQDFVEQLRAEFPELGSGS